MKTSLLLTLLLLAQFTYGQSEIQRRIEAVENSLAPNTGNILERMKARNIKGVSIAVVKDYKIEWAKAYGYADESESRKADTGTLFQAASISKTINSMAILKLVQMGKLDLDKDINTYLKTWKFPYKDKIVTTRMLLAHSAGLTVSGFPGYRRGQPIPTLPQVLNGKKPANTKAVRSFAAPGSAFEYSGGGTIISQLILTDITGEDYESFVQREVLAPLDMQLSRYDLKNDTANIASAYNKDGVVVPGKYHIYPESAAAGLWTTPSDIARYMIECQLALEGRSSKVLTKEFMEERFKPVVMYGQSKVGLGVFHRFKNGAYYFNHNGGNEGFSCASYGSLKDGYGVVVMTNSSNSDFMLEVCNSVAIVYNWDRFYVPVSPK